MHLGSHLQNDNNDFRLKCFKLYITDFNCMINIWHTHNIPCIIKGFVSPEKHITLLAIVNKMMLYVLIAREGCEDLIIWINILSAKVIHFCPEENGGNNVCFWAPVTSMVATIKKLLIIVEFKTTFLSSLHCFHMTHELACCSVASKVVVGWDGLTFCSISQVQLSNYNLRQAKCIRIPFDLDVETTLKHLFPLCATRVWGQLSSKYLRRKSWSPS